MQKIASLIDRLRFDYPAVRFLASDIDKWDTATKTLHYNSHQPNHATILHELGHALLGHHAYGLDIELIAIERDAWQKARDLAKKYHVSISEDTVEDALDSYRDWMHARSTCPRCLATGIQTAPRTYGCVACKTSWHVNDAKTCGLRRYKTQKTTS